MQSTNFNVTFFDSIRFGLHFTESKMVTSSMQQLHNISETNNLLYGMVKSRQSFLKGNYTEAKNMQKPNTFKIEILLYILLTRYVKLELFGRFLKYVHEIYLILVLIQTSVNNVVVHIIKNEVDLDPDQSEDHSNNIQNSKCHTAVRYNIISLYIISI